MSHPDEHWPALEETLLTSLGIADAGWVADRATISGPGLIAIRELLETRLTTDLIGPLMADLGRGFADAVEMADSPSSSNGSPSHKPCHRSGPCDNKRKTRTGRS